MTETPYSIGEGPATRVSRSLPEGTAEAIRQRGQILAEYLADYERRQGPISSAEQDRARQVLDEVFAE
ncbi:hypothetical protein [Kitasatospora sp. McL0602]|uniref:hypothetical protein n=1 Tax=Kitasatospora sp. McL0602 TaxID=3439530 RepID=UPI003F893B55